ncbi:O-methyltransferase, partial [Aspergillus ellipticus CBS 707.79]
NNGRESALLTFIQTHATHATMQNNPAAILAAIDEFGRERDFLMNFGTHKGAIVTKLITDRATRIMVELGGYVGYSAILFGSALQRAGGQKYISLELNPHFADIARSLIHLARLQDVVEVMVGGCRDSLRRLREGYLDGTGVDMFFFDHAKVAYVDDLKLCEELGLVRPGTTVLADNVVVPGTPKYLAYVRRRTGEKVRDAEAEVEAEAEAGRVRVRDGGDFSVGNPYLVYDTLTVRGLGVTGEEDAVEVSYCVGSDSAAMERL